MPKTPREQFERPARTVKVKTLEEAVVLAQQYRDEGEYDWFRGQVEPWPPHSSLFRRFIEGKQSEYLEARRAVDWLIQWAREIPELVQYLEGTQPYGILAIAQHYGIPTNLIDFTTSPLIAGYFASDSKEAPEEGISCIYCLNTERLKRVWSRIRATRPELALIETVRIDVHNLWRLKAQHGAFLHANYQWDLDYPMDRILFPYSGPLSDEQVAEIYPQGKSPLEQLLDQHFSREQMLVAFDAVKEYLSHSPQSTVTIVPVCQTDADPSLFRNGRKPAPLPSWSSEKLSDWHKGVVEDYTETVGSRRCIDFNDSGCLESSLEVVKEQFAAIVDAGPELRTKDVVWEVRGLANLPSRKAIETGLRLMWNGMRRLPYSNKEISESARSIGALVAAGFHMPGSHAEAKAKAFASCFGSAFLVRLACDDGSHALGYASSHALWNGVRPDMPEILVGMPGDLDLLFRFIVDPRIVYEFAFVKERFVREIIPSQIVHGNSYIVFNPATLTMMGHP